MANASGGSITWDLDVVDKGFTSGISKASAEATALGATLDKTTFANFSRNASSAFSGIASGVATAAKSIAIFAAGSSLGIASFVRSAADLQQTSKSFEVLIGDASRANQLFAQIKRFADTTPFQFPELANSARTLLGFGVGVDDVFKRLKVLGDISAVTGADLQSLAVVFGQVTGAGRLMGQDALQLVNNNIPITTILTKKLGISAAQLRKRIEEGSISAEIFTEALTGITEQGGIAFQGTDKLALTFNGRLSTLKDTVAEFGRNLLGVKVDPELGLTIKPGGVFDILSKALPKITESLTKFAPKVTAAFEFLVRNGNTIIALIGGIAAAFVVAKAAAIGFAIAAALANPFQAIALAITLVIGALTFLQLRFGIFTKGIKIIKEVLGTIGDAFSKIKDVASDIANNVFGFLKDRIDDVAGAFKAAIEWLDKHKQGLKLIGEVIAVVVLPALVKVSAQAIATGTVMTLQAARSGAGWALQFALMTAKAIAFGTVSAIQATIAGIRWAAGAVIAGAAWLLQFGLMIARAIVTGAIFVAQASIAGAAWLTALGPIALAAIAIGLAALFIIHNWGLVKDFLVGVWSFVKDAFSKYLDLLKFLYIDIPKKILGAFAGIGTWLYEAGKDLIRGLINGVKAMAGEAVDAVKGVVSGAVKGAKNLLGIKSPSKVFMEIGQNVGQGMVNGLKSTERSVNSTMSSLTGGFGIDSGFNLTPSIASAGGFEGNSSSTNVNVTLNMSGIMARSRGDLRDISKDMIRSVNEELSAKGEKPIGGGVI